ncbi:hypothetical protein J2Z48_001893 [Croceifilum oryzae]|uniref:Uncharacterized protein n=1 Tax=Croceifilum oryzae TaxID=1553429 RepID=A0AAJ1TN15_9BACL|nr:hypothetical protein [Croceifilum oryzae]MDQ0417720.1 hypothetical protein [Croceifilum oryzae]
MKRKEQVIGVYPGHVSAHSSNSKPVINNKFDWREGRVCSIIAMLSILLSVAIRNVGRFWCNMFERSLRVLHLP